MEKREKAMGFMAALIDRHDEGGLPEFMTGQCRMDEISLYENNIETGEPVVLANWNDFILKSAPNWWASREKWPRDDDNPKPTSNFFGYLSEILERMDLDIDWSDEYARCDGCGAAVRTQPDSYGWSPRYIAEYYGEILCENCVREDKLFYDEEFMDQNFAYDDWKGVPDFHVKVVPENFIPDLKRAGWRCFENEDACELYQTGWHRGMDDHPAGALKGIQEALGDQEFWKRMWVFAISDNGQFHTSWTVFFKMREVEEEEGLCNH